MIQILQAVSSLSSFTPGCASLAIPGRTGFFVFLILFLIGLTDKIGDVKAKQAAGDCLTSFSENTSFGFVLNQSI